MSTQLLYTMKKRYYIIVLLGILAITTLGIGYTTYKKIMAPLSETLTETVYFTVYPTDNAATVSDKITMLATIKSSGVSGIAMLMRYYKYDERIKPGHYAMRPNDSARDLCLRLLAGNQSPIRLVVPSVRTLDRLAGAVGKQLMTDSATIMTTLSDSHLIDSLGYTTASFPALFIPNTYEVYWTMTAEQFVARMVKENKRYWNTTRMDKAKTQGLTPTEVITLASIVDEETNKNDEKPIVAGLYLNRLHRGMLLQADPTVKFALGEFELRRILFAHLEVDSPYNTYKYAGLPPGPIRIPSMAAIESVLNPAKHNYIYMCAKEDFTGYHNFASTLSQHNANARRYQQALNRRGIK